MSKTTLKSGLLSLAALAAVSQEALAHHPMGGTTPATLVEGLLSGFGHPIIGLDHLAALIAVGCIAARQSNGALSAIGYVFAMAVGAALHVQAMSLPFAELWVALSVIALGAVLFLGRNAVSAPLALGLFAITGLVHGYALGESIVGAESTPLTAYFAGLIVIQSVIVLGVMMLARKFGQGSLVPMRVAGAGVAAVGLVVLALTVAQSA